MKNTLQLRKTILLAFTVLLTTFTIKAQYYVNINATGNSDGSSWADADTSLYNALSLNFDTTITEVWVAKGLYKPTSNVSTFSWLIDNLEVYGGFDGTETSKTQRDWRANETIMSGDVGVVGDKSDNCSHVFYGPLINPFPIPGLPSEINYGLLDGFIIEDGYNETGYGSGIVMQNNVKELVIQNCTIRNNTARYYGGIYAEALLSDMKLTLNSCIIQGNETRWGVGTAVIANGNKIDLTISNCMYFNNKIVNLPNFGSGTNGVVIMRASGTSPEMNVKISNTTFANNHNGGWHSANRKATLQYHSSSTDVTANINIDNCIFWGNTGDSLSIYKSSSSQGPVNFSVSNTLSEYEIYSNSATTTNIIDSDPLFTNALNFDFTLQDNSPALNKGVAVSNTPDKDLAGNTRIINDTIDLGCYENQKVIVYPSPNAISDLEFKTLKVYPNPSSTILNIELNEMATSIMLKDITGKTVRTFKADVSQIDVSNINTGIYFLEVANESKKSVVKLSIR